MQWARTFLLGVAVSAIASTLLLSGTLAFLADYALVGVFVVAPGLQTRTALAALRRSLSPIWPVLRAGVAYWAGASIILAVACMHVAARTGNENRTFDFVTGFLMWSLTLAAGFTAVIVAVTGSLSAWRARH